MVNLKSYKYKVLLKKNPFLFHGSPFSVLIKNKRFSLNLLFPQATYPFLFSFFFFFLIPPPFSAEAQVRMVDKCRCHSVLGRGLVWMDSYAYATGQQNSKDRETEERTWLQSKALSTGLGPSLTSQVS